MSAQFDRSAHPESDGFEDDLVRSLAVMGGGFETDPAPLISSGLALGRRVRRRRRRTALAGVAALALAGVVTTVAVGLPDHAAVAPAAPVHTPAPDLLTRNGAEHALRSLLPSSGKLTVTAGGPSGKGVDLAGTYDDGHGPAAFTLSVFRMDLRRPYPADLCLHTVTCKRSTLPDGSRLTVTQRAATATEPAAWYAQLSGTDGRMVNFGEVNAPEPLAHPTRPEPPLTTDQLAAVATAPIWADAAMAVPLNWAYHEPVNPDGRQILEDLTNLLPGGVDHRTVDTLKGYAALTADDDHGRCLIEINVEDWSNQASIDRAPQPTAVLGWDKLPDGTRIRTGDGADDSAGDLHLRRRYAEAFLPDGLRILVSVINAPGHDQARSRPEPVLTTDQLKEIVLSPVWRKWLG